MRVLVLNDFFGDWSGSELVAIEIAEYFSATTSSFWCANPVKSVLEDWQPLDDLNLCDFDLVWAQQHAILPLLDRLNDGDLRPHIVWASLSPYEPMEVLPKALVDEYVDLVVANSSETARARGIDVTFGNAAPSRFHVTRPERPRKRVLFVSNNQPEEMLKAAEILHNRGYQVRFIGRNKEYKRIEPSDILWADCVVTIGKTARYALATGTPVFVYDRFGGDGYLNDENYSLNEEFNFSGRPTCRKLSAVDLAHQIIETPSGWLPPKQESLEAFLDKIAAHAERNEFLRHPDLEGSAAVSAALGSWLVQTHEWKSIAAQFERGQIGSWKWLAKCVRKKIVRTPKELGRAIRLLRDAPDLR
ncbi:MAG: hypothetical protein JXR14_08200 [Paracoccaceae bacterium]